MGRHPIGNLEELRGRTQLLPQLSRAGIGLARFRGGAAFDSIQGRSQGNAKVELLSVAFRVLRQELQLVQSLVELRRGFGHCRADGRPMTSLAPVVDSPFDEPGLGVMLSKEL